MDASISDRHKQVRFPARDSFYATLKQRVEADFAARGLSLKGGWRLKLKTAFILTSCVGSYVGLLFAATTWWHAVLLGFVLAQSVVLIGFCVMHDGGHNAFSERAFTNRWMGRLLDLIGGNQFLWNRKHNILHHTYTNVEGHDDDLDSGGMLRFHPQQQHKPWHRYQAFYALPLYCFLALYWVVADFKEFFAGKIGDHPFPKPARSEVALFWGGKAAYFVLTLGLPLALHPWWVVLPVWLGVQFVLGFTLALVFQLAHVVEGAAFPVPDRSGNLEDAWATHQLLTTVNFAPRNPVVSWYTGGLNHQVEHHLFTKVSHIHYRRIAVIVKATCGEFGMPYLEYPTVRAAIGAHLRQLHALGRPAVSSATVA